ncbi:insulinase family protein, partial [Candidatus Saccharibacteria bacterium]|nr:insulinase family protein [Candidatus Saccharibacteria bacterium]NIW78273.1 hypothetical protein [Calditrichia bacterium]
MKQKAPIDDRLLQYKFPETQEKKLNNGLTVIVIERPVVPKIYFRLALNVGEKYDPPEMEGAFEMMARLLKKGTEKRSYSEIVEAIDFAGGMLEANSSKDFCYVYGEFLKEHSDLALNLLSEVVMHPLFLPEELEKERAKMIAELENEKSSPAFLAQRQMDNALYFPHPYARFKTKDSLQRITRQALEELHQQYFAPQNAFLAIGGDLTFKQIMNQLENKCSSWRERESNISEIEPPA